MSFKRLGKRRPGVPVMIDLEIADRLRIQAAIERSSMQVIAGRVIAAYLDEKKTPIPKPRPEVKP